MKICFNSNFYWLVPCENGHTSVKREREREFRPVCVPVQSAQSISVSWAFWSDCVYADTSQTVCMLTRRCLHVPWDYVKVAFSWFKLCGMHLPFLESRLHKLSTFCSDSMSILSRYIDYSQLSISWSRSSSQTTEQIFCSQDRWRDDFWFYVIFKSISSLSGHADG